MKPPANSSPDRPRALSRREFLESTATPSAIPAAVGLTLPHVHAAENNTIHLALIGCGGRGPATVGLLDLLCNHQPNTPTDTSSGQ